jgi:hypothetical protein
LKQPELSHGGVSDVSEDPDDDVTIFMADTTISEIIDIKNHIPGNATGN